MFKLQNIEKWSENLASNFQWTNTYGVARSVLALGSLITLMFNDIGMLVQPLGEHISRDKQSILVEYSLFSVFVDYLFLAKALSIVILTLVIIGWRPRITGILHFWVAFSISTSCMVIDGGDQIAGVMALLLVPVCLADGRKWNWEFAEKSQYSKFQTHMNLLAIITLFVIRLQVAFIYFHAGVGKFAVEEWMNGTALYYWSNSPLFMMPDYLRPIIDPIFENPYSITLSTWSIMAFEVLLFLGLVMEKKYRKYLMWAGMVFHISIILLFGLVSFFCSMAAALVLYLGPIQEGFKFPNFKRIEGFIFKNRKAEALEMSPAEVS